MKRILDTVFSFSFFYTLGDLFNNRNCIYLFSVSFIVQHPFLKVSPFCYEHVRCHEILMGKVKKSKFSRHDGVSLADQVLQDDKVKPTGRTKSREVEEKDDEVTYIGVISLL